MSFLIKPTMIAIEFNTQIRNGTIKIPVKYKTLDKKEARIIILTEETESKNSGSSSLTDKEMLFFQICGIWKDRDITKEILRDRAWRAK